MIIYVARCKDLDQAIETQNKLIAACSTLVYTRVLRNPHDLDVFNAEFLRSGDEDLAVGHMAFAANPGIARKKVRLLYLFTAATSILLSLLVLAGVRLLGNETPAPFSLAIVAGATILALAVFGLLAVLTKKQISPERKIFWRAERWLSKGNPLVLAASDNPPDSTGNLPKEIFVFDNNVRSGSRKSA